MDSPINAQRRNSNNSEDGDSTATSVLHAKRELREVLEIEHSTEITAFSSLRQFMFIGDNSGTIEGFTGKIGTILSGEGSLVIGRKAVE